VPSPPPPPAGHAGQARVISLVSLNGHIFAIIQRQRDRKHRPFTHLALNHHISAQEIYELLDDSQPQTRALIFLGGRQITLVKPFEDLIQIFLFVPIPVSEQTSLNDPFC